MTSAPQPAHTQLTDRQRGILDFIETNMRDRGYPPSVREIGEAVGLSSSATVHNHLGTLQKLGYLHRDPTKPRAIEVRYEASSGVAMERRPTKHVPLVGDVAAGVNVLAQENVEELVPLPMDFTGDGELFMLRVRGNSMITPEFWMATSSSAVSKPPPTTETLLLQAFPATRQPSRHSQRAATRSRSHLRTPP